jgi:hypothetical protein
VKCTRSEMGKEKESYRMIAVLWTFGAGVLAGLFVRAVRELGLMPSSKHILGERTVK